MAKCPFHNILTWLICPSYPHDMPISPGKKDSGAHWAAAWESTEVRESTDKTGLHCRFFYLASYDIHTYIYYINTHTHIDILLFIWVLINTY